MNTKMALSDTEQAICAMTGTDPSVYVVTRDASIDDAASNTLSQDEHAIARSTGVPPGILLALRSDMRDGLHSDNGLTSDEETVRLATGMGVEAFKAARGDQGVRAVASLSATEIRICHATGTSHADFLAYRYDEVVPAEVLTATCSMQIGSVAAGKTVEMQLLPSGMFKPSDGRSFKPGHWYIDDGAAKGVIAAFQARRNPAVLDYEHQTLHKEANGRAAPAAGWITSLTWRPGEGLFGSVELTDRARNAIAEHEYRYVSPVFSFDPSSGRVRELRMAGLTNDPALDGMRPVSV